MSFRWEKSDRIWPERKLEWRPRVLERDTQGYFRPITLILLWQSHNLKKLKIRGDVLS